MCASAGAAGTVATKAATAPADAARTNHDLFIVETSPSRRENERNRCSPTTICHG
jgi:hypothetical protein